MPLLLWLPRLGGAIDLRYDAGVYYILGTSLAEGKGYRLLNEPGDIQAVQYPPLLPALVAAHQWALGTSRPEVVAPWLRRTYFLLSLLYALAVYTLARAYLGMSHAVLAATITSFHFLTVFLSDLLFAEIPFALVTLLFIILGRRSEKTSTFALTALLGCAAYLLRAAGIALLAAWVGESLVKMRWRQAAARAGVCLLPVAGWQAYISHVLASDEYKNPAYAYQRAPYQYYNVPYSENLKLVDSFAPELGKVDAAGMARRVGRNLATMSSSLGESVTAGKGFWVWTLRMLEKKAGLSRNPYWLVNIPLGVYCGIVLAGVAVFLARGEWFLPFYLGTTAGLVCLTPWPAQFTRYLAPVTPLLAICLFQALVALKGRFGRRAPFALHAALKALLWLVAGTALSVQAYTLFRTYNDYIEHEPVKLSEEGSGGSRLLYYSKAWESYRQALAWLKGQAAPADVIAASAPHWAYLLTGLKAVLPPMEIDAGESQRLLDSVPVRYVILDDLRFTGDSGPSISRYAGAAIAKHPESWDPVYSSADGVTRVYKRHPPGSF